MTDQTQPKKKMGIGMLVLVLVGGCFALSVFMAIGMALSYGGVALGLLAVGGGGYLLVKGPPERRKLALGGAVLGALLIAFGFMGASTNRAKAKADEAAAAAAAKKVADEKAAVEKAVAQLSALGDSAAASQLVTACSDVQKLGAIPSQQMSRCGDAFLAEGQAALAAKRSVDAVALFEQAAKLSSKKDEVAAALTDAKVALAVETNSAEATRAEQALEANDSANAAKIATAAAAAVAAAQKLKPDDAPLKELAARLEVVQVKADPAKRAAAEKAAFEAMEPPDHLKAAKDALADGYDAKLRTGGRLEDAEKHLGAIVAPAKEEQEAKALRAEVEARRKRQAQLAEMERIKAIKARRASRQYLKMGPDQLAAAMMGDDMVEKLDTQWKNKWVRWQMKYRVHSAGMGIIFDAGRNFEIACDSIDEDEDKARFAALKKWQQVTIEGQFMGPAKFQKALDGDRLVLNFEQCSIQ